MDVYGIGGTDMHTTPVVIQAVGTNASVVAGFVQGVPSIGQSVDMVPASGYAQAAMGAALGIDGDPIMPELDTKAMWRWAGR